MGTQREEPRSINTKLNMSSNKKLRRNIKRLADKKGITYELAILHFYKIDSLSKLDKHLLWSLYKNTIENRDCSRFY